jgi:hypothetical protein
MQDQLLDCNSNITVCVCVAETITIHARSSDSDAPHRDVTRCLSCARKHVVGKEVIRARAVPSNARSRRGQTRNESQLPTVSP